MNRYALLIEYTWYGDYTGNEHKGSLNYTTVARNVDEAIQNAQKRYGDTYSHVVVKNIFSEPYTTSHDS